MVYEAPMEVGEVVALQPFRQFVRDVMRSRCRIAASADGGRSPQLAASSAISSVAVVATTECSITFRGLAR